jgi:hypothetical protein
MANKETGNAINANNFIEKIAIIERRKTEYNPTNAAIKLAVLTPAGKAVKDSVNAVSDTLNACTAAVNKRHGAYTLMESYATRAIHLLNSSDVSKDEIKQGKALLGKFKSQRVSEVPDEAVLKAKAAAKGEEAVIPKVISTSQLGFTKKLRHFRDIILFLKTVAAYKPNETDLTVEALDTFANSVDDLNAARSSTASAWLSAISERNKKLYQEPDGAYFLSNKFMEYVAGAYGKKSDFYKELQRFPIRNHKG